VIYVRTVFVLLSVSQPSVFPIWIIFQNKKKFNIFIYSVFFIMMFVCRFLASLIITVWSIFICSLYSITIRFLWYSSSCISSSIYPVSTHCPEIVMLSCVVCCFLLWLKWLISFMKALNRTGEKRVPCLCPIYFEACSSS
jgi:hypothetical protein